MIFLLFALLVTAPAFQQVPNSACYLVTQEAWQARPCRVEEVR